MARTLLRTAAHIALVATICLTPAVSNAEEGRGEDARRAEAERKLERERSEATRSGAKADPKTYYRDLPQSDLDTLSRKTSDLRPVDPRDSGQLPRQATPDARPPSSGGARGQMKSPG